MKFTFDTNTLLSATLWDGSVAQKLLHQCINRADSIYTSKEILDEYQEILKRDFDYSDEDIANIMEKVFQFVTIIEPKIKLDVVKDDPDDNMVVECAVESKSQYIISYNKHLLKLGKYENTKVIKPEEAMKILD